MEKMDALIFFLTLIGMILLIVFSIINVNKRLDTSKIHNQNQVINDAKG